MASEPKEYWQLSVMGREVHDYWKIAKPKMYREMLREGTLWEILNSMGRPCGIVFDKAMEGV